MRSGGQEPSDMQVSLASGRTGGLVGEGVQAACPSKMCPHHWAIGFALGLLASLCRVPGLVLALFGCHPQTALEAAQPRDGHVHAHGVQEAHVGALGSGSGGRLQCRSQPATASVVLTRVPLSSSVSPCRSSPTCETQNLYACP